MAKYRNLKSHPWAAPNNDYVQGRSTLLPAPQTRYARSNYVVLWSIREWVLYKLRAGTNLTGQ